MKSENGLAEKHQKQIVKIISGCSHVESALLFGSRALGTHKPNSDIDIAIVGDEITTGDVASLLEQIESTTIPYKVDIVVMHKITSEALINHIRQYGQNWL